MRALEFIVEGGWDTKITQGTTITPKVVGKALELAKHFVEDFNRFLKLRDIAPIKMGYPTGSSAYHEVDTEDKIYGDIDLQIVVPEIEGGDEMTTSQAQGYWYKLLDEFVKSTTPPYVHPESTPGHPILHIGDNEWVQIDLMPHTEKLATWGRFRTTPERGVKGLLNGNMFSVLGEMLTMSIQHSGVQYKDRDGKKMPYSTTRKDYKLHTITTNVETFVYDIFKHEAQLQAKSNPTIDPLLRSHPGSNIKEVKISNLVNAVKGLARSFEANEMFGTGDLAQWSDAAGFLNSFWERYEQKAQKDIAANKRDKAETPEAKARANDDKKKIIQGLAYVKAAFEKN